MPTVKPHTHHVDDSQYEEVEVLNETKVGATVGRQSTIVFCAPWGPGGSGGPLPRGDPCSLRRSDPDAAATAESSRRQGPARR
eukprot:8387809-Pyramimonas_sp.AAC.1